MYTLNTVSFFSGHIKMKYKQNSIPSHESVLNDSSTAQHKKSLCYVFWNKFNIVRRRDKPISLIKIILSWDIYV